MERLNRGWEIFYPKLEAGLRMAEASGLLYLLAGLGVGLGVFLLLLWQERREMSAPDNHPAIPPVYYAPLEAPPTAPVPSVPGTLADEAGEENGEEAARAWEQEEFVAFFQLDP